MSRSFHRCVSSPMPNGRVLWQPPTINSMFIMRARRPPCLFYLDILDPPFLRVNKCLVLEEILSSFFSPIFLCSSYVLFRHWLLIIMDPSGSLDQNLRSPRSVGSFCTFRFLLTSVVWVSFLLGFRRFNKGRYMLVYFIFKADVILLLWLGN